MDRSLYGTPDNRIPQSITEVEYSTCLEVANDIRWLQKSLLEIAPNLNVLLKYNEVALKLSKTQTGLATLAT